MKNLSFTLLLFLFAFAANAQVTQVAGDDFDNPVNLNDRTITVDMAFMNNGDAFGVVSPNTSAPDNTPFALVDDTNPACPGFFEFDNQGAIPCAYDGGNFFGMVDTENPDNMGPVMAEWEFDISSSPVNQVTIDFAAMGDFENSNDNLNFEYSVDGGAYEPLFMLTPDEDINAEYTLFDGDVFTLNDPMTLDGVVIINQLTTFTKDFPTVSGSTFSIRLTGMGDGGSEAVAFDNISINNASAAAIPTMGEWALFLFSLVIMTLGVVFVYNIQNQMSTNAGNVSAPANLNTLPFDQTVFAAAIKHALGLAVVGFVIIYIVWGEIVPLDLIGMALTIPMVAYILHVLMMFKSK